MGKIDPTALFLALNGMGAAMAARDPRSYGAAMGAAGNEALRGLMLQQQLEEQKKAQEEAEEGGVLGDILGTVGGVAGSLIPGVGPIVGPAIGAAVGGIAGDAISGQPVTLDTLAQRALPPLAGAGGTYLGQQLGQSFAGSNMGQQMIAPAPIQPPAGTFAPQPLQQNPMVEPLYPGQQAALAPSAMPLMPSQGPSQMVEPLTLPTTVAQPGTQAIQQPTMRQQVVSGALGQLTGIDPLQSGQQIPYNQFMSSARDFGGMMGNRIGGALANRITRDATSVPLTPRFGLTPGDVGLLQNNQQQLSELGQRRLEMDQQGMAQQAELGLMTQRMGIDQAQFMQNRLDAQQARQDNLNRPIPVGNGDILYPQSREFLRSPNAPNNLQTIQATGPQGEPITLVADAQGNYRTQITGPTMQQANDVQVGGQLAVQGASNMYDAFKTMATQKWQSAEAAADRTMRQQEGSADRMMTGAIESERAKDRDLDRQAQLTIAQERAKGAGASYQVIDSVAKERAAAKAFEIAQKHWVPNAGDKLDKAMTSFKETVAAGEPNLSILLNAMPDEASRTEVQNAYDVGYGQASRGEPQALFPTVGIPPELEREARANGMRPATLGGQLGAWDSQGKFHVWESR